MLAAGARPEAAELSGIRVKRVFVLCHTLTGILAGFAAVLLVARNGAAIPSMAGQLGQDWLLPAFLGPVLGGTLLTGGKASPIGTFLGAVPGHGADERAPAAADRSILGAGHTWRGPARGGHSRSRAPRASRAEEDAVRRFLARHGRADWLGLSVVTLLAIIVISWFSPNFLSRYNIQVLLLAISVNALVAYSQMIIIAIGQMNLSVGAIGGPGGDQLCGDDGSLSPADIACGGTRAGHWPVSLAS